MSEDATIEGNNQQPPISKPINDINLITEQNTTMKNDFISHCLTFLQEDDETRQCIQNVWSKYLKCVGDVAMLSAFFDTLPRHLKASIFPKYKNEIIQWCENIFHIKFNLFFPSAHYSDTFQRIIRFVLKSHQYKKAIVYIPLDFDPNLKNDLASTLPNIKFEYLQNNILSQNMINIDELEQFIKRDINDIQSYPFMVIANAGSTLLGRCDELTKLKQLCDQYDIWLHVIGDLLASLALLPKVNDDVRISADSLTIDTMKTFGIQNLPYLSFILPTKFEAKDNDDHYNKSSIKSNTIQDYILHNPSINYLSIWSISQRCTNDIILHHMKQSLHLTDYMLNNLKSIKHVRILNDENDQHERTYKRICSGDAPDAVLPTTIIIFRFQPNDELQSIELGDSNEYVDLLNVWLFDRLSQQFPKMNLELLKSVHFQTSRSDTDHDSNKDEQVSAHAIRFAPLEHLYDDIEENYVEQFTTEIQRLFEILVSTMTARINLSNIIKTYENLVWIPIKNWAGIGAVRYIPATVSLSEIQETSIFEINTIQAELVRQLQTDDSAFSLGGTPNDDDSILYIRLGMIRKSNDLEVLLQKIANAGKKTETSLKYIEHMAEKIKIGIEKAQKDLQDENLQLLAQEGILRQLPIVSSIISWWSPPSSTTVRGRSFDLNSGQIESTENTYAYRIQVKKQPAVVSTHNDSEITSNNSEKELNSNEENNTS